MRPLPARTVGRGRWLAVTASRGWTPDGGRGVGMCMPAGPRTGGPDAARHLRSYLPACMHGAPAWTDLSLTSGAAHGAPSVAVSACAVQDNAVACLHYLVFMAAATVLTMDSLQNTLGQNNCYRA